MTKYSKIMSTSRIPTPRLHNVASNNSLSKSITFRLLFFHGFCLALLATMAALPTAEGAAIPSIGTNILRGFGIRRDQHTSNSDDIYNENDSLDLEQGSQHSTLHNRGIWGSLVGNLRNRRELDAILSDENDNLPQRQQSLPPFACWLLARSFGSNGNSNKILQTVMKHPQWLLVGGAVYQSQKALRSEAFRRAARFWAKIGPVVAHYKFTRWWLQRVTKAPLEKRDAVYAKLHNKYAPITMQVALDLKGLYVKLAQVVSSRPDFVPLAYIQLFVAAQDSLPQWPIDDVRELVDEALKKCNSTEVLSLDTVFEEIDAIALGSASIGQCHRAKIRGKYAKELLDDSISDSDDLPSVDVAIKVMHPGAEERFKHDFSVFRWLCKVALTGWEPILDELYRQIMSEFDYTQEAYSLETVRTNMHSSPFSKSVKIPQPLMGLCSKELLVMELLEGPKLSDSLEGELRDILGAERSKQLLDRKRLELVLGSEKLERLESIDSGSAESIDKTETSNPSPFTEASLLQDWATKLRLLGLYRRAQSTIDKLVDVQGYQMLKDGVFQGDPHPGNILELTKTKSIASHLGSSSTLGLIDYGQTKIITEKERLGVAKVILALGTKASKDEEEHTKVVASAMRDLGFSTKKNDPKVLAQYAGLFFDSDEVGKELYDCPTPQTYFKLLTELDPLVEVPDVAIFVARCGFILRGMGSILGKQIKTSERWSVYAKQALEEAEQKR